MNCMKCESINYKTVQSRRSGFTLIELLIVVAVIGVLLGLLSGGIVRSVESARRQRRHAEARTLMAAIYNYWHDYNRWPHKEGEEQVRGASNNPDTEHLRTYESQNWKVFNRLSYRNKFENPLQKPYLDEASLNTTTADDGRGSRTTLQRKRGNSQSAADRSTIVDYKLNPFRVTFDLKQNTVNISYRGNDGKWKKVDREI